MKLTLPAGASGWSNNSLLLIRESATSLSTCTGFFFATYFLSFILSMIILEFTSFIIYCYIFLYFRVSKSCLNLFFLSFSTITYSSSSMIYLSWLLFLALSIALELL